jgi:hypothetical protein
MPLQNKGNEKIRKYIKVTFPDADCDEELGPVSEELRTSMAPEFFSTIKGVRGVVLAPDSANHLPLVNVASAQECSHRCHVSAPCDGFTWQSAATVSVISALKSILSIGDNDGDSAGQCFLFDRKQAADVAKMSHHPKSLSGIRDKREGHFSDKVQALMRPANVTDANQFSSRAIRVSFGGGKVDGWQIDSGKEHAIAKTAAANESSPVGTFGWSCSLTMDTRQRAAPGASDLTKNLQLLSRHGECASPRWVLKVAPGIYRVVVGYSDPTDMVVAEHCKLNGEPAHDGATMSGRQFEFQSFQEIKDGTLAFSGHYGQRCTSIAYIVVDDATHYFE